jgi:hypothetical protein
LLWQKNKPLGELWPLEGFGDAEIAGMFGMDRGAIRQRRKKLEAKYGPGFGVLPLEVAQQAGRMLKAGRSATEILAIMPAKPEVEEG